MDIQGKSIFVTGANRGIGAALVRAFLKHGAGKVYAAARNISSLPEFRDGRVSAIQLDITKPSDVDAAASAVSALDILVNNAGIMTYAGVLSGSAAELAADMNVNYFGTLAVTQKFLPLIERQGRGAIVNIISIAGLAPPSVISGYSASKAALASATQASRAVVKSKNIEVIGVFPGPIDTDPAKDLPLQKAPASDTAEAIVEGVLKGQQDIYPDPTSAQLSGLWSTNPKGLEQFFASM